MEVINPALDEACQAGDVVKASSIITQFNVTYSSLIIAMENQHDEIISLHLEFIELNENQEEILHWAARIGYIRLLKLAKKRGWNINAQYAHRKTIHIAAIAGEREVIWLLIKSGANANDRDVYGSSPLHYVCSHGHVQVAELLLSYGADPDALDLFDSTPFYEAVEFGDLEVFLII